MLGFIFYVFFLNLNTRAKPKSLAKTSVYTLFLSLNKVNINFKATGVNNNFWVYYFEINSSKVLTNSAYLGAVARF